MSEICRENRKLRNEIKEKRISVLASLFGCWHQELSRPFTSAEESYRVCLRCGARRRFNPKTLETFGRFYFSPVAATARKN